MKLMDFLIPDAIESDMRSTTKEDAVRELVALLKRAGAISDEDSVAKIVLEREELGTTGIGEGIAVPHGKSNAVDKLVAAFGRSEKGIDFASIDNQPVHLLFLLVAPIDSAGPHLMALARISRLLKNTDFRASLKKAKGKSEILEICESEE
jgi:PTS system nitrogen regulatory IIA component